MKAVDCQLEVPSSQASFTRSHWQSLKCANWNSPRSAYRLQKCI